MILTTVTFMFLVGLLLGWFTGFNVYKIIFIELVMMVMVILLVSLEATLTGSTQASVTGLQDQVVRGVSILYLLAGVKGMFLGMYLKHKSLQVLKVDK